MREPAAHVGPGATAQVSPGPTAVSEEPILPAPPEHSLPPGPLLLNADDAGALLGLPRRRLYTLGSAGELPSVLIGGRRYWRREDLVRYVANLALE